MKQEVQMDIEQTPVCCPYCTCKTVSRVKETGMIEIGPLGFDQEESMPVDIWTCGKCQRRFIVLDDNPKED
jgi:ribosomal protein L37AE/L43A